MATSNINIRTDAGLKAAAQETLSELGLDMSTAINIFLRQVVYKKAIPFEISAPATQQLKIGGWEGKIKMSADFDEPLADFKEYME